MFLQDDSRAEDSPYLLSEMQRMNEKETTPGAYAQYTYTLGTKLTAMAGVRFDHSSLYGNFFTPRFHVKYSPIDAISIRLSAGKGYRTVFGLAEYNYLLASGRNLNIRRRPQARGGLELWTEHRLSISLCLARR